jgi:hypothetical protein
LSIRHGGCFVSDSSICVASGAEEACWNLRVLGAKT